MIKELVEHLFEKIRTVFLGCIDEQYSNSEMTSPIILSNNFSEVILSPFLNTR